MQIFHFVGGRFDGLDVHTEKSDPPPLLAIPINAVIEEGLQLDCEHWTGPSERYMLTRRETVHVRLLSQDKVLQATRYIYQLHEFSN